MAKKLKLQKHRVHAMGGIAKLTLATQPDGKKLIVRELLPKYIFNLRMHRRFVRGTKIREQLTPHPNIVFSAERGYEGLKPYEVIEFVPGKNLSDLIREGCSHLRSHAFEILKQSANALAYMHEQKVLHLDVKAENFLLDTSGQDLKVKLTDFDLSCDEHTGRDRYRSGTLSYMAPEQVKKGKVGIGSDMFAFGIFAYFLVTGRMPFEGETKEERNKKQLSLSYTVVPPSKHAPDLAPKLDWIIMRCLEKDPDKRFPNMVYLRQELGGK